MTPDVEISGWESEEARTLYWVSTVEWGEQVTRWADDLRAVGRCVAEADAGSTVTIRVPDKPAEELDITELKEMHECL